jgi:hypothetical protein
MCSRQRLTTVLGGVDKSSPGSTYSRYAAIVAPGMDSLSNHATESLPFVAVNVRAASKIEYAEILSMVQ